MSPPVALRLSITILVVHKILADQTDRILETKGVALSRDHQEGRVMEILTDLQEVTGAPRRTMTQTEDLRQGKSAANYLNPKIDSPNSPRLKK